MLDRSQIMQAPQQGNDRPPPPAMVRIHNPQTGVQVVVTDDKAAKLIATGTYKPVPAAEQPPKQQQQTVKTDTKPTTAKTPAAERA